jgi:hypothetical protein
VVAEHPGTPWALLAAEDLERPMGYRWEESFTPPSERMEGGGNNATPTNPADEKKKMLAPPKKRDLRNL